MMTIADGARDHREDFRSGPNPLFSNNKSPPTSRSPSPHQVSTRREEDLVNHNGKSDDTKGMFANTNGEVDRRYQV
jgi:hypothetical protein